MAVRAPAPAPARPVRALLPEAAPAPAERRHLQVVPPGFISACARRKRARLVVLLAGVAIAGAMFGVVAFHVVLTQNQLDLQHLRAQADAASVEQQQLRLQAAQLESPERVVDAAQKLGMVPPATVRYLSPNGAAASGSQLPSVKATPTTVAKRPVVPKTSIAKTPVAKTPVTTTPTTKAAAPKTATTPTTAPVRRKP